MPDVEKLRKEAAERARKVKKEQGALSKVDYTNPEKARADQDKKITDYYTRSAYEAKLVLDCFIAAGFTREEAFVIVKNIVAAT